MPGPLTPNRLNNSIAVKPDLRHAGYNPESNGAIGQARFDLIQWLMPTPYAQPSDRPIPNGWVAINRAEVE